MACERSSSFSASAFDRELTIVIHCNFQFCGGESVWLLLQCESIYTQLCIPLHIYNTHGTQLLLLNTPCHHPLQPDGILANLGFEVDGMPFHSRLACLQHYQIFFIGLFHAFACPVTQYECAQVCLIMQHASIYSLHPPVWCVLASSSQLSMMTLPCDTSEVVGSNIHVCVYICM